MPSYLDEFHAIDNGLVRVTPEQASRFAKEVAGDFNPIHDPDAKRFCVPGDLLFCLVLARYGVSARMAFSFTNMVGAGVGLHFPATDDATLEITDGGERVYLRVERDGEVSRDGALLEGLTKQYAAFSGQNFPHVMVPLMKAQSIMVNPQRPLVFYESMALEFTRLPAEAPTLSFTDATMAVNGKRGDVVLEFALTATGEKVGTGRKKLVISGLRPFEQDVVDDLVSQYDGWKAAYRRYP